MLCLLTYITEPYTSNGRIHNCFKIQWPDLLNDTVTNCLNPHTEQWGSSDTKLKAHLSEGDDSTIYLHTTEDDGSDEDVPSKSAAYAKNKNNAKNDVLPDKNRVMEQ